MENTPKTSTAKKSFLAGLGLAGGMTAGTIVIIIILLLACCMCCFVTYAIGTNNSSKNSGTVNTSTNNRSKDQQDMAEGPKEGDTIEGLSREEIERNYNEQKKLSQVKADNYADSIKGQKVIWIAKISSIDNEVLGTGYNIYMKMGGYSVVVKDVAKKYGDLNKNQLVKVTANIESLYDLFGGVTVYLDNPTIEVIQ